MKVSLSKRNDLLHASGYLFLASKIVLWWIYSGATNQHNQQAIQFALNILRAIKIADVYLAIDSIQNFQFLYGKDDSTMDNQHQVGGLLEDTLERISQDAIKVLDFLPRRLSTKG